MSVLDRICELLAAQRKKQKDLTDYLGISKNSFTDWKSGRVKSYTKHIPQIADFLGVSTDYLLGIEESPIKKPLSEDEERLMELYNMTADLSEAEITALKAFCAGLKANRKQD